MKKLLFIILFANSAAVMQQTNAMQGAASRTAGQCAKQFAKRGFSGFMTTLHWTLAGGPLFSNGIQIIHVLLNEEEFLSNPQYINTNPQVTQFIQKEMQTISTNNQNIHVKTDTGIKIGNVSIIPPMGVVGKHHIIVSPKTENEIANALEIGDTKTLAKWQGALHHENEHLKNNDSITRAMAAISIPFMSHWSLKTARNFLPFAKQTSYFLKEFIKIPSGCAKSCINLIGFTAILRHQEQRADNGVKNDLATLNGLKNCLEEIKQQDEQGIKSASIKLNIPEQNMEKIQENITNIIGSHPPIKNRIAKLDERTEVLEIQQKLQNQINTFKELTKAENHNNPIITYEDLVNLFKKSEE